MTVPAARLPGGPEVSRLIQGTMAIDKLGDDGACAMLDGVLELGCTTFDTAHVYGDGENERMFGRWLRSRGTRDEVVIIGKGCEPGQDGPRVTPEHLTTDLHESLDRMGIDHVDLYLVHVDDPAVAVQPIVDTLAEHAASGLIGSYGVSNWSRERIEAAQEYARSAGLPPIVTSSVHFSLASWREQPWPGNVSIAGEDAEPERRWYAATGLPLLSWSTLAGGFFSGRVTRQNRDRLGDYFDQVCARAYGSEQNFARLERAQRLGEEIGATAAQVALAWAMKQPLDVVALVGSLSVPEFAANMRALDIDLTTEQSHWLVGGAR